MAVEYNEGEHDEDESQEEKAKKRALKESKEIPHYVGYKINRQLPQEKAELGEENSLVAHAPLDFSDSFMAKLRAAFIAEEWRIQRDKNIVTITSLVTPNKQISIKKLEDRMVFSGSAQSEKEIVLAANAYQAACQEEGEKVIFEIKSKNENSAIAFMTKLKNEGFNINEISAVNLKEGDLAGKSMKEYTKELIEKVNNPNKPPSPKPKPMLNV